MDIYPEEILGMQNQSCARRETLKDMKHGVIYRHITRGNLGYAKPGLCT